MFLSRNKKESLSKSASSSSASSSSSSSSPEVKSGSSSVIAENQRTSDRSITEDLPIDAGGELLRAFGSGTFLVAGIPLDDASFVGPVTSKNAGSLSPIALNDNPNSNLNLIKPTPRSCRSQLQRSPKVSLRWETSNLIKPDLANQDLQNQEEQKGDRPQGNVELYKSKIEKLEGELRDVAAVEGALYSVVAEHGSSSLKVHSPARRLARVFRCDCQYGTEERRASCGKTMVAGLITTARACGNDIPRLTFWWSNTTILRETIAMDCELMASTMSNRLDKGVSREKLQHFSNTSTHTITQDIQTYDTIIDDWATPTTLIAALERIEAWIFAKVVDSVWWQVLTPYMQRPMDFNSNGNVQTSALDRDLSIIKNVERKKPALSRMFVGRQGATSVEIWKTAFMEVYRKLCPVQAVNMQCGCLPMLSKMVMEECLIKLDITMFNAILRGNADHAPTNPVLDPISNYRVLPIIPNTLSFAVGAQLKNVIGTLCEWLASLLNKDARAPLSGCVLKEDKLFPTLKALGDLLMLPKYTLLDGSLRNEVCPLLSSSFIARILSRFEPDEFAAEPVPAELIELLNKDAEAEVAQLARAPTTLYVPPDAGSVRQWIGDEVSRTEFGRSNSSILRKGSASDDEMDEMESPIAWLLENTQGLMAGDEGRSCLDHDDEWTLGTSYRFQLLREAWAMM